MNDNPPCQCVICLAWFNDNMQHGKTNAKLAADCAVEDESQQTKEMTDAEISATFGTDDY